MKFAFCLSTAGGSPLQVGLERGLHALGHNVVCFRNGMGKEYDVLVLFNQVAHTQTYAFPDWPTYDVPVVFVDAAEYGYFRRFPEVIKNYANGFASGSMSHDTRSLHEQTRLKNYLAGKSFPYFLREFSNYLTFPPSYHPIDYPLYLHSMCSDKPDRGDYLRRTDQFFVSWGASHPWRWNITNDLRKAYPGAEVLVIEENGTPRMAQSTYFNRMMRARASVSFDGYGSGSFRMTEVLVRTVLLMGPLSIRTHAPLVDGQTCVAFEMRTEGEKCYGTNIAAKLKEILQDPERSFRIYEAGYDWAMTNLTETATARYFLEVVQRHDWSKPTPLEVG